VVFPDPFGPNIEQKSPCWKVSDRLLKMVFLS